MTRNRNLSIICFVMIFLPVFLGYEVGRGLVTDANPFNAISLPVFPVGSFFVLIGLIFTINKKNIAPFIALNLFFGLISLAIYGYLGLFRQFSYNVAILLACAAYYFGMSFSRRNSYEQIVRDLTVVLVLMIFAKLAFDFALSGVLYSDFFIVEKIKIYNAYDYFPIVYLLSGALGILVFRDSPILGGVAVLCSFIAMFSYSRFYAVGVFLLYIFSLMRFYRVRTVQLLALVLFSLVVITGVLAVSASSFKFDPSLSLRFGHWYHYFGAVSALDLFFPVLNTYRNDLSWGGLHNELLDLYSYFGIFIACLGVIFARLAANLNPKSKVSVVPFLVVLSFGMLVQNNFTQPYNTVVIFFLLGLFQAESKHIV